jgi:hypothetical protein
MNKNRSQEVPQFKQTCEIWGSHDGDYEDILVVGSDAVNCGIIFSMFRYTPLPPIASSPKTEEAIVL